jgi:Mn-dependent DtxR family transcriptional regulator
MSKMDVSGGGSTRISRSLSSDEFILHLLDLAAEDVYEAAEAHRLSLKNPSKTVAEYLNTLESQGLVRTVAVLRLTLL